MKLEKYYELQKKFENQRFEIAQKYTALILHYGSILGNILSIILSFFFVNHLTKDTAVHFSGQAYILPVFILLFLTIFELAKRFTFANVVIGLLTTKKTMSTSFIGGLLFVTLLVGTTFYLSLSGASTYANKAEVITATADSVFQRKVDSLTITTDKEVSKLEERITYLYNAAKERKNKSLKPSEIEQVRNWEVNIKTLKIELKQNIEKERELSNTTIGSQTKTSNDNQLAFILISAFIEILILIGVFFKQYYSYHSYMEQKIALESNSNYQKLIVYKELLKIMFNNGKTKPGSTLPSVNKFKDLVYASTKQHSLKTIKEFYILSNTLKISQLAGKTRTTLVSYEKATEILENYLTIE